MVKTVMKYLSRIARDAIVRKIDLLLEKNPKKDKIKDIIEKIAIANDLEVAAVKAIWYRASNTGSKDHGNRLFSNEDELVFVGVLEAFSLQHNPLSKLQFLNFIKNSYPVADGWNGDWWYKNFIKRRQKTLQSRKISWIKEDRVSPNILQHVEEFIESFSRKLRTINFPKRAIVNADETRLFIKGNVFIEEAIESTRKRKKSKTGEHHGRSAGLLVFASADGKIILSVYILPVQFQGNNIATTTLPLKKLDKTLRGKWDRLYCFTDTGYLNNETWKNIMEEYILITERLYPSLDNLLILDGLGAHMQANIMMKCLDHGVHTIYFPSNCSHFIQPLDDNVFTNFKKILAKECNNMVSESSFGLNKLKDILVEAAPIAEEKAFTEKVIKSSFFNTGIYPFDEAKIKRNAKMCVNPEEVIDDIEDDSVEVRARKMATMIIQQSRTPKKAEKVRVRVEKNAIYTDRQLIDKHNELLQKEAEKKRKGEEKALGKRLRDEEKDKNKKAREENKKKQIG